MYERFWKRLLDLILSAAGLVLLSWLFLLIAIAVFLDDPGPVLFTQKRIGIGKSYFRLHKFRSMKMRTPHDIPTHLLENPEQYITRVGKFLRKSSLDELPQIWDIFTGHMSVIGPRPALWNQDDLIAERDKYGANDVRPGLTGWAQVNGRDELEIPVKAKLDGEYVKALKKGGLRAFAFDCKCFAKTLSSVAGGQGVVEGGTGRMRKRDQKT
ncbi:MAG: sugar transferase [Butyrivibrio sp.]|nr:sugar transferase [Butyrivibrio sp.]